MEAIFIVAIIFGSIASLFIVPRYFKSMERQKMADTLRVAIEKGQPLPTEVIEAMSSNVRSPGLPPSPQRDLRTGIIWLGVKRRAKLPPDRRAKLTPLALVFEVARRRSAEPLRSAARSRRAHPSRWI